MGKHTSRKTSLHFQLICSLTLFGVMWTSGMVPMKYLAVAGAILLVLLAITFGLQFVKNKAYIAGIVISVIMSLLSVVLIFALLENG